MWLRHATPPRRCAALSQRCAPLCCLSSSCRSRSTSTRHLSQPAGRALLQRSGRAPDDISSIVLVEPEGRSYIKSDAVLRIAGRLGAPLPLVAAALGAFPRPVKDGFYDFVADNRYSFFGRTPSCRLSDPRFEERFISS